MTSPIDVAYVQIEPSFMGFATKVRNELREAFTGADTGGGFGAAGAHAGRQFAEGFTRDANGRLHDELGRFAAESSQEAFNGFRQGATGATAALGGFVKTISLWGSVAMFALPPAIALGSALAHLIGLLAALPAAGAVGAAIIAPLVIGFSGFADALKTTSRAGGAAVDTLGQVADAEYRLEQAQRQRRRATEDVARATRDATRQLEDLNEAVLDGARDETGAQLAVEAARRRLRGLRGFERREARQDFDEAVDRLEDIRRQNTRNAEDLAAAQKKGVQGSDQVVAARQAEADAIHAIAEAQKALAQAQQGGGGGGGIDKQAAALAALAPAARSVAEEIIGLKPRFTEFRQSIQQALFEPLIGDATRFVDTTLPHIQTGMTRVAGTIGEGISSLFAKLSTPRAGEFFDKVFASADKVLRLVGPGVERLFTAIGMGTEAGLPFIERFASAFGDGLKQFGDFIIGAIEDGRFQKWIEDGIRVFEKLKEVGGATFDLIKNLFTEENMEAGLQILNVVKNLIEFTATLVGWFNDIQDAGERAFITVILWAKNARDAVFGFFEEIPAFASRLYDRFLNAGKRLIRGFFAGLRDVSGFVGGLAASVGNAIRGVLNDVLTGFNQAITAVDDVLPFSLPRIPALAAGGLATGPTLAMIGEGGHDEAVIPLGDARAMSALAGAGLGGQSIVFGPGSIQVSFDGGVPSEADARRTGAAVGRGILDQLAARNIRTAVRTR